MCFKLKKKKNIFNIESSDQETNRCKVEGLNKQTKNPVVQMRNREAELVGAHLMNSKLCKNTKYKLHKQSHFDGGCGHLSQTRAYAEGEIKQAPIFLQGIITNG